MGGSRAGLWGHNPELGFGEHKYLFRVKFFLALLFAMGNIAVWGHCPAPGSALAFINASRALENIMFKGIRGSAFVVNLY